MLIRNLEFGDPTIHVCVAGASRRSSGQRLAIDGVVNGKDGFVDACRCFGRAGAVDGDAEAGVDCCLAARAWNKCAH